MYSVVTRKARHVSTAEIVYKFDNSHGLQLIKMHSTITASGLLVANAKKFKFASSMVKTAADSSIDLLYTLAPMKLIPAPWFKEGLEADGWSGSYYIYRKRSERMRKRFGGKVRRKADERKLEHWNSNPNAFH
jgi:hypothetical protein